MTIWIVVAATGFALSLAGLAVVVRRYRQGRTTGRMLAAIVVAYASFVAHALATTARIDLSTGLGGLLLLAPGLAAIVVIVREHRRGPSGL